MGITVELSSGSTCHSRNRSNLDRVRSKFERGKTLMFIFLITQGQNDLDS
jgi:hypothetical protein